VEQIFSVCGTKITTTTKGTINLVVGQIRTKTKKNYLWNKPRRWREKNLGRGTNQDYIGNKKTHFVEQIFGVYETKITTTINGNKLGRRTNQY
jgi:hypothetical protein